MVMTLAKSGDAARWQAVLERDRTADGSFVYTVQTTQIYCRPTCPSKRPKRENARFFDSAQEAEYAGFRPCRRCQPDEVSREQRVVTQLQALLETRYPTPTLSELAAEVDLSPTYVQRLFKRVTGFSPKRYANALRAERFSGELRAGESVTGAMYEAGYGSSHALYRSASQELGMKPKIYQAGGRGERVNYALFSTSLGRMLLAATDKGVCALRFGEDEVLVKELKAEFPKADLQHDTDALAPHVEEVLAHLDGTMQTLNLPLDVQATDFQKRVWNALRRVPYGETRSYAELAEMIGQPKAVRAVARACATNPVALSVPCHRIVRSGGQLSGYRWGVERKAQLLGQEAAQSGLLALDQVDR